MLIEFALILPIMLLVLLGGQQVISTQIALLHAAQQAAVAGANEPAVPRRCDTALAAASVVYGSEPDAKSCSQPGNVLEVILGDRTLEVMGMSWPIRVVGRAVAP